MRKRMIRWLVLLAAVAAALLLQVPLVKYGHPQAVWLWCSILEVCEP